MQSLYRRLLYLYPTGHRHEYAVEMAVVFREAEDALAGKHLVLRCSFYAREISGVLAGALREHVRGLLGLSRWISFRRFDMRPDFRFPRSTVFLMAVILAGVLLTIEKATAIEIRYGGSLGTVWPSLPWFFVFMLLTMGGLAVIVWAILFALRRTGSHRLANVQTWPEQK
jgi:hypothetical protein